MLYYYSARSADGLFVRGSVQAASAAEALSLLSNRGLFVSLLDKGASIRGLLSGVFQIRPVSQNAIVALFRSLATLTRRCSIVAFTSNLLGTDRRFSPTGSPQWRCGGITERPRSQRGDAYAAA